MEPVDGPPPGGEQHQPTWRKVLLLGVPLLLVVSWVAVSGWTLVSDRLGAEVARAKASDVERVARAQQLTARDVTEAIAADDPDGTLDRLAVPGTELASSKGAEGAGNAYVALRSTAWGGRTCIVLAVGNDGDISSRVRRCGVGT